ncbi:hypothetical protein LSH36_163g01000 [Paralvinella palmiformis]|uniref:glutaminase n=1 Tax=Paralvinella palmiformis TaxID=53620 RepID=A0AAD9JT88_9ANNE|nr:hypothetical protein LSH36_163g01000 [Paralvinella palmiformis]
MMPRGDLIKELDKVLSTRNFEQNLYELLKDDDGKIRTSEILQNLHETGIRQNDPRLQGIIKKIRELQSTNDEEFFQPRDLVLDKKAFFEVIRKDIDIIRRAFTAELIIPDFKEFKSIIDDLHRQIKANKSGTPASYIPQLARVNPDHWGISVCSIDGQRHCVGSTKIPFSIQSTCKPINYALAVSEMGGDEVHRYVGHEPSGESFNHIKLGHGNKPHNPMINAGAIMVVSLLKRKLKLADRFDSVQHSFRRLAGGEYVGFSNAIFLSERETADRNFALAYYMKENKCFPEDHFILHETMDFYFQLCSLEVTCESASVIAATLANGGICPTSGEQILDGTAVRNTLSLMHSCGMYDYSGEFAFKVGLPAKSGVSGIILLVIPNVAGICLWSPPLDKFGNSVRGINFCQELVKLFNFHHYDNLRHTFQKMDPRVKRVDVQGSHIVKLLFSASNGDLTALRRMALAGNDMAAVDYDGRTALHLAAAEGQLECVRFLLERCKVEANPKDRWGQRPYDDAIKFGQEHVASYLEKYIDKEILECITP